METSGIKLRRSLLVICWSFRLCCLCFQKFHMHFAFFWIKGREKLALCSCTLFPKLSIISLFQYLIPDFNLPECVKDCPFLFSSHIWRWWNLKRLLPFWNWSGSKWLPPSWGWVQNVYDIDDCFMGWSFVYVHVLSGFFPILILNSLIEVSVLGDWSSLGLFPVIPCSCSFPFLFYFQWSSFHVVLESVHWKKKSLVPQPPTMC